MPLKPGNAKRILLASVRLAMWLGILGSAFLILPVGGYDRVGHRISFQTTDIESSPVWLIAGPFSDSGDNSLFKDYLRWVGGEAMVRPLEGGLAGVSSKGLVRWQKAEPDSEGLINFKNVWPIQYHSTAYAYTEINSDSDRYVVATVLGGMNLQVRLNGDTVYENRLLRNEQMDKDAIVLHLKKGANTVLVKVQELVEEFWQFEWKTHLPAGSIFVNQANTLIADLSEGRAFAGWGQVEVVNASGAKLSNVTVEVMDCDLAQASKSEPGEIDAGATQRIPIWINLKSPNANPASGPVHLRVTSGTDEVTFDFAPRIRKTTDYFFSTYRSGLDGSVQHYSVWLPDPFEPSKTYPLIVLLHGSTVDAPGQNIFAYSSKPWAIEVAPHDRGDNFFREAGEVDLDEMLAEVSSRYKVDPDRVYLSGHSMGGYGVWYQATRHPDRYASVSAQDATTDASFDRKDLLNSGNTQQDAFQLKMLAGWSPINFAENMMYVPVYVNHGGNDTKIPTAQSRQMCARLKNLGYTYVYHEAPGQGHWWGGYNQNYGAECVDSPAFDAFFQQHLTRIVHPSRIVYVTDSLRFNKAYWITIDDMDTVSDLARVEANVGGANRVNLRLTNVARITLALEGVVTEANPITVNVNGVSAFAGQLPASRVLTLQRTADGSRFQLVEAAQDGETTRKTHDLFGPIADAFNTPFLFVVGTGLDSNGQVANAAKQVAESLARDWMSRANGIVHIKNDVDITAEDITSHNLILFGNTRTNSLIDRVNGELPVQLSPDGVQVGSQYLRGTDLGIVMAAPNPLNRHKYVVIVGGNCAEAFRTAGRLCLADLPDYVVFDGRALKGKKLTFVAGGYFDKNWQIGGQ